MLKNIKLNLDYMSQLAITLPHSATQSLLPSPLKPQLYHIILKSTPKHFKLTPPKLDKSSRYGLVISFYYLISVKWVIILVLPI